MIHIVHFCAKFQKFFFGGGSNLYEKAYFAPLICEKILASVYCCPSLNIFCPPLSICSAGAKNAQGGQKKSRAPLYQKFIDYAPPEKNP